MTTEVFGLELFARVAAVVALGGLLGGEKIITILDYDAEGGPPIKASSRVLLALGFIGSFWRRMARTSAT